MEKTLATILCVDDEENQLVLRKLLLERAGYRVLTAESPARAIALFRSDAVDLVIVDYYMPGMNGLALAREMLLQKKLPVIVLSAYAELPGESIGTADTWIMKGTASEELLRRIAELLSRSAALGDQAPKSSEA
jgi:DNA-binding response OmpR family regulator